MWQLDRIRLQRFQSHLDSTYEFYNNHTTMVYGINYDDPEGADSNGSGKSALIRAITVALIGIPNKELGKEEYVMDGQDDTCITLELSNKAYKKSLKIQRIIYRSQSKGAECKLWEDNVLNRQIISSDDGTVRILSLLDITSDDLLNYYIINQDNSHSFFKASDGDKKKIIARFTKTDLLDVIMDEVEADLKILEMEIDKLLKQVDEIETRQKVWREQIVYEKTERKSENDELVENYAEQLESVKNERENLSIKLLGYTTKSESLNKQVLSYKKKTDEKILESKIKNTKLALSEKKGEKDDIEELISEANKILQGEVECPNCKHIFSISNPEADIVSVKEDKVNLLQLLEESKQAIITLKKEIDVDENTVEDVKDQSRNLARIKQDIESLVEDVKTVENKIATKDRERELIAKKIEDAKNFVMNSKRVKELESNIALSEADKQSFLQKIEDKTVDKNGVQFWKINFSELGLKTFLINKVLENLEGHINNNLRRFKVNLVVKINGYTVLKSKKVRESIDVLVSKDGKSWKPYKRFSGGQKERVNVSGILTLHELINESSMYGGLNFLGLDEFFEGLDQKGQKAILPILEASGITCMVISHVNNNIGAQNELMIEYEDEVSTIKAA